VKPIITDHLRGGALRGHAGFVGGCFGRVCFQTLPTTKTLIRIFFKPQA
jgi:hypothetical protein